MRELSEIGYSQEACVAAVRDYYRFLAQMYLDESAIIEPPEGGWPEITADSLRKLGKNDAVISLLRHLPYIRNTRDDNQPQGAPWCEFADWRAMSLSRVNNDPEDSDYLKVMTETPLCDDIPPHVVALTSGREDGTMFLLDIKLGVVYWPDCWGEITSSPFASRALVYDDPYTWAPEKEADWRATSAAWALADFFEVLKDQFRELHFIPTNLRQIVDVYTIYHDKDSGMTTMLQDIYRNQGWPDLERYNKRECLRAVKAALENHYPDRAG